MSGQAAAIARVRGLNELMRSKFAENLPNMWRIKLYMQEYLRLRLLWSNALHIPHDPFIHLAVRINISINIDNELKKYVLEGITDHYLVVHTLIGYVLWEMLDKDEISNISSLPSPYEPLMRMYEEGGRFYRENGVCILYDAYGTEETVRTDQAFYEGKESFLTELGE